MDSVRIIKFFTNRELNNNKMLQETMLIENISIFITNKSFFISLLFMRKYILYVFVIH